MTGLPANSLCEVCGAREYSPLYETRDRHYGIRGAFSVVRCDACGFVFLDPVPSAEQLAPLYPEDYYSYLPAAEVPEVSWPRLRRWMRAGLGLSIHTRDPAFAHSGRLLDIGCGAGEFLREARDRGWSVTGVELSQAAAELGRARYGLDILKGTIEDVALPAHGFDYVRSNHAFEHISSPNETLEEIRRILAPGGKLMLGVPNIDGLNARLFRRYWWYLGAPVHPFNYSVRTLTRLLERHDFQVERVTYNGDYTGVLGSLQIFLNRRTWRRGSEGRIIGASVPAILVGQWLAKLMNVMRVGDAIEVTASLRPDTPTNGA